MEGLCAGVVATHAATTPRPLEPVPAQNGVRLPHQQRMNHGHVAWGGRNAGGCNRETGVSVGRVVSESYTFNTGQVNTTNSCLLHFSTFEQLPRAAGEPAVSMPLCSLSWREMGTW